MEFFIFAVPADDITVWGAFRGLFLKKRAFLASFFHSAGAHIFRVGLGYIVSDGIYTYLVYILF